MRLIGCCLLKRALLCLCNVCRPFPAAKHLEYEHIDIVDVFRKDSAVPRVVEEAIAVGATTVWAQLGVISEEARTQALAAGLNYGDNLCLRTEHEAMMGNVVEG